MHKINSSIDIADDRVIRWCELPNKSQYRPAVVREVRHGDRTDPLEGQTPHTG